MTTDEENACLRAALMTAHDHLHKGNVEAAHRTIHDAIHGEAPRVHQPNLTVLQSSRVALFSRGMMRVAESLDMDRVAWIVALPSASTPGAFSFQIGGNAELVEFIKGRMGA